MNKVPRGVVAAACFALFIPPASAGPATLNVLVQGSTGPYRSPRGARPTKGGVEIRQVLSGREGARHSLHSRAAICS